MIKAIIFDLDDTLFDSTALAEAARKEACNAMVNAGIPDSVENSYKSLLRIVKKYGSNDSRHFDRLCNSYGIKNRPDIIASGVVAYHNMKFSKLHMFPRSRFTLTNLMKQRYKLALVTNGIISKQWEKITRLKIKYLFDEIMISEKQPKSKLLKKALSKLNVNPSEILSVGNRIDAELKDSKKLGMKTVRILQGKYSKMKPKGKLDKPDFNIKNISEIIGILKKI
ncbi:TIGR02253 family HAD-type hydrolase [Nanoarchaeota archaeon]